MHTSPTTILPKKLFPGQQSYSWNKNMVFFSVFLVTGQFLFHSEVSSSKQYMASIFWSDVTRRLHNFVIKLLPSTTASVFWRRMKFRVIWGHKEYLTNMAFVAIFRHCFISRETTIMWLGATVGSCQLPFLLMLLFLRRWYITRLEQYGNISRQWWNSHS